jgi:hypothetical protein
MIGTLSLKARRPTLFPPEGVNHGKRTPVTAGRAARGDGSAKVRVVEAMPTRDQPMGVHDLDRIFRPGRIAVIGAVGATGDPV